MVLAVEPTRALADTSIETFQIISTTNQTIGVFRRTSLGIGVFGRGESCDKCFPT